MLSENIPRQDRALGLDKEGGVVKNHGLIGTGIEWATFGRHSMLIMYPGIILIARMISEANCCMMISSLLSSTRRLVLISCWTASSSRSADQIVLK